MTLRLLHASVKRCPPSRVEVTFRADGDATLVRLVHSGLADAQAMGLHREGWTRYLAHLVETAAA